MDDTNAIIPVTAGELVVATTGSSPTLVSMGSYDGTAGTYEIFGVKTDGEPGALVESEDYKLFVAKLPSGQLGLMKINATPGAVALLEREARILNTMQNVATQLDSEAASPEEVPYYGAMFPNVVETVIPSEDRFVMFLGYHPTITTYRQLVPVSVLAATQRVDLKSIQWMLGKLFKLEGFAHSLGFNIGLVHPSNELVETNVHGVFVLDFSNASEDATDEECRQEVADAAKIAWHAAGGNETSDPPYDAGIMSKEGHSEYVAFLKRVMSGETEGANAEQAAIYEMADRIWPKEEKTDETGSVVKRPFHAFVPYAR